MASATDTLPHWDLSNVYPGLDSPEFRHGYESFLASVPRLVALFDRHAIGPGERRPLEERTPRAFEDVLEAYNAALLEWRTLATYIDLHISTDSRHEQAQALRSELQQRTLPLVHLEPRFTAWVGSVDIEALLARSAAAREHAYTLRLAQIEARHQMSEGEESLAAELHLPGARAWARLHGDLTSQLMVRLEHAGTVQDLPMSAVRNLAHEGDRELRRSAYQAELASWERSAVPLAAAFNGVKGETIALARRRNWDSPLAEALHHNHLDRQTLDAMLVAVRASFPDFRRYLYAKAAVLGVARLAWYDLFAPIGRSARVWRFDEARDFILEHFEGYSGPMRALAERAFAERWIDAEPRPGKSDGGFCAPLRPGESRILVNYSPAFDGLSTLAHELGHAYHGLNLATRTPLQQVEPMTLAETASTFCETIVQRAALRQADTGEQFALLEASLQGACQIVVDIASRFLFESRAFAERAARELSGERLNALMLEAQRETYGDGLEEAALHPYMWAVKPHYYSNSFYNFPYTFGQLFGTGLYARYQQDPEGFRAGYDTLLASTGTADAATLADGFGIDIRTPDFWHASLDVVRQDIARFEELVAQGQR